MKPTAHSLKREAARLLGSRGGKARAKNLTPLQRSASARHAVNARWRQKREQAA